MGSGAENRHPQPRSPQQGTKAREGEGQRRETGGFGTQPPCLAQPAPQGDLGPCPRPGLRLAEEALRTQLLWKPTTPTPRCRAGAPPTPCPLHLAEFDSAGSPALYLCCLPGTYRFLFSLLFHLLSPHFAFLLSQHLSPALPSSLRPLPTLSPRVSSCSPSLSFLFLAVVPCPQIALPRLWAKPRPCQSFSLRGGPCPGEWASKPAQPGALPTRPHSPPQTQEEGGPERPPTNPKSRSK